MNEEAHHVWRKSSHSGTQENCVEIAAVPWRKSSYSGSQENCVQIAAERDGVLLRDSKAPDAGVLTFDHRAASALFRAIAD